MAAWALALTGTEGGSLLCKGTACGCWTWAGRPLMCPHVAGEGPWPGVAYSKELSERFVVRPSWRFLSGPGTQV